MFSIGSASISAMEGVWGVLFQAFENDIRILD